VCGRLDKLQLQLWTVSFVQISKWKTSCERSPWKE